MSEALTVLTPESCREALKAVIDPEIYQNIVDLGLVYGVDVGGNDAVDVTMTFTTPMCPLGPQIVANVEHVLLEKGASQVNVAIVWEPMWTPDAMTVELQRELGIIDDEPEPQLEIETPPAPPIPTKKRGLFGRLIFGT